MTLPSQTVEDPRAQRNFEHLDTWGVPITVLDHTPADDDFPFVPADGTLAVDSSAGPPVILYIRLAGVWTAWSGD